MEWSILSTAHFLWIELDSFVLLKCTQIMLHEIGYVLRQ